MNSTEILAELRLQMPMLKKQFNVDRIGVFGSYSRNEQTETSDIDVLVKFTRPELKSLIGLLDFLENRFNKKVDIVTEGKQLSERFRKQLQNEIIYA